MEIDTQPSGSQLPTVSVSEFIALMNQTLEYALPFVQVEGEISELRISKGKWVYCNLIDEQSSVRVFGTVYQLRDAYEDGMRVIVKGSPRLHNKYGFSLNLNTIQPSGEGSIKRAFELLKKKLAAEGLFDQVRKRKLPEQPQRIGLITSSQAAAYEDFIKIINQRWSGLEIRLADVAVQGVGAPGQIVRAIEYFATESDPVDVLVLTRGGGGAEDLVAFSTEEVTRAIAASRVPTIVGVGHEVDVSLADLAADVRATTPTNAAQLVVPDKESVIAQVNRNVSSMGDRLRLQIERRQDTTRQVLVSLERMLDATSYRLEQHQARLFEQMHALLGQTRERTIHMQKQLNLVDPLRVLKRGYSLVTDHRGKVITSSSQLKAGDRLVLKLSEGSVITEVTHVENP